MGSHAVYQFSLTPTRPFEIFRHVWKREGEMLRDVHFEVELGIVRSGRVLRQTGGAERELGPGGVWLCSMWERHSFRILEAPCEQIAFVLSPDFLSSTDPHHNWLTQFLLPPHRRLHYEPDGSLAYRDLAARLAQLGDAEGLRPFIWRKLLLFEILLSLEEAGRAADDGSTRRAPPEVLERIQPSLSLVFSRSGQVSVDEAAAECGMSRSTFSRSFRVVAGSSFARFARQHRLQQAANQLVSSRASIKSIARSWGFSDLSHFDNCFARQYRETPGSYRARHSLGAVAVQEASPRP